jgi:hypothetical protein
MSPERPNIMRERRTWIPRIMGIQIGLLAAGDWFAIFGEKSRGDITLECWNYAQVETRLLFCGNQAAEGKYIFEVGEGEELNSFNYWFLIWWRLSKAEPLDMRLVTRDAHTRNLLFPSLVLI